MQITLTNITFEIHQCSQCQWFVYKSLCRICTNMRRHGLIRKLKLVIFKGLFIAMIKNIFKNQAINLDVSLQNNMYQQLLSRPMMYHTYPKSLLS